MNADDMKFPGAMPLDIHLSPGTEGRLIKLCARSFADLGGPPAPGMRWRARDVTPIFVEAIERGLFRGPQEGQRADILNTQAHTEGDERTDEWELMTPPLDLEAFRVLARMFWSTGARALSIAQNAPPARLTVRDLESSPPSLHPPPTDRPLPWKVDKHIEDEAKDAVVMVCFKDDPPREVVSATHATLKAWAAVVAFGGFEGPALPTSSAVLSELGTELPNEVFASFEGLQVRPDGWAALWNGLSRIHRLVPIARVEMR